LSVLTVMPGKPPSLSRYVLGTLSALRSTGLACKRSVAKGRMNSLAFSGLADK
jgi:hypothetical protein